VTIRLGKVLCDGSDPLTFSLSDERYPLTTEQRIKIQKMEQRIKNRQNGMRSQQEWEYLKKMYVCPHESLLSQDEKNMHFDKLKECIN